MVSHTTAQLLPGSGQGNTGLASNATRAWLANGSQLEARAAAQEQKLTGLRGASPTAAASGSPTPAGPAAAAAAHGRELEAQRADAAAWCARFQLERDLRLMSEGAMGDLLGMRRAVEKRPFGKCTAVRAAKAGRRARKAGRRQPIKPTRSPRAGVLDELSLQCEGIGAKFKALDAASGAASAAAKRGAWRLRASDGRVRRAGRSLGA